MTTNYPPAEQRTPPFPAYPPTRPRTWPAVALSGVAAFLGAAALIVALTRPTTGGTTAGPATSAPTYTAAEVAAAHQKVCDVYKLAARAVQIQTNIDNQALGVAALVNGAVMLQQAVNAAPALAPADRTAALALAEAYTNTNAIGSFTHRDDPQSQAVLDDVNTKDARMKAVCGGG